MYINPPKSDIRKMRPLIYQPSDLVVWKSYFCRYQQQEFFPHRDLINAHSYSHAVGFAYQVSLNKQLAMQLQQNLKAIIDARDDSP